jgi:ceramide glucosyltransferase
MGAALENLHLAAFITLFTVALFHLFRRVAAPGKSTLLRRRSLDRIGGFEELGRYVAEDYLLVERLREHGERTVLGKHLVANVNAGGTIRRFYDRHFRWTQLHFRAEPLAAIVEPLTHPVLPAVAWCAFEPSRGALAAVVVLGVLEAVCDLIALRALRGSTLTLRFACAAVLRPFLFLALWARASYSRRVVWRGNVRWLGAETLALEEHPMRARIRTIRAAIRLQ